MAKPLIVNVIELLRWPGSSKDIAVEVAADDFEFEDARIVSEPIAIAVHMEAITNGVSVSGVAHAAWAGECRRCLTPLRELMQVEFDEMYQPKVHDAEAYEIENDQINLLPMVRENILLALPLGPLCREDCPGFCLHCGTDLSQTQCGCVSVASDPRWAVLDALKDVLDDPS